MSPKKFLGWIFALVFSFLVVFVFLPVFIISIFYAVPTYLEQSAPHAENVVAVIEVQGAILDAKDIVEELHRQVENDEVKGIVLRIDSPGGAVGPAQDIYSTVKQLKARKPIIASLGGVAASGGFYAALGATKIFAQPGTLTGSIGVIVEVPDVSRIMEKVGVTVHVISSGQYKDTGSPFRALTEKDRGYLQSTVDIAYEDFVRAVVESRGLEIAKVREFADGRVILGSQAKEYGLIDEFGTLYEAARTIFDELKAPLATDEFPELFYPLGKLDYVRRFLDISGKLASLFSGEQHIEIRYGMP